MALPSSQRCAGPRPACGELHQIVRGLRPTGPGPGPVCARGSLPRSVAAPRLCAGSGPRRRKTFRLPRKHTMDLVRGVRPSGAEAGMLCARGPVLGGQVLPDLCLGSGPRARWSHVPAPAQPAQGAHKACTKSAWPKPAAHKACTKSSGRPRGRAQSVHKVAVPAPCRAQGVHKLLLPTPRPRTKRAQTPEARRES